MNRKILGLTVLLFLITLCSCQKKTVFLSDRHGLSYDQIKQNFLNTKKDTLILFDFHNDVNFVTEETASYNWVGKLIKEDVLKKVYWICGYDLSPSQLDSKQKWLLQNAERGFPEDQRKVQNAFFITDFTSFNSMKLQKNYAVTVDFDLFTLSEISETRRTSEKLTAEAFVLAVSKWIKNHNPDLTTLCLSAVYQPVPEKAWNCLDLFLNDFSHSNTRWILKSGEFGEKPESNEDLAGWENWTQNQDVFMEYDCSFFKGAYLWINTPEKIRKNLLAKKISCENDDETTAMVIESWKNKDSSENAFSSGMFTKEYFDFLGKVAFNSLKETIDGKRFENPEQKKAFLDENNTGVAVRFRKSRNDRGCFALHFGLDLNQVEDAVKYCAFEDAADPRYEEISEEELPELFVNLSIFNSWIPMKDCYDFVPGYDSVVVENQDNSDYSARYTLLQASIASEYSYTKEDFLKRLCKKAGIPQTDFSSEKLKYYKASTVTYTGCYD